MHRIINAHIITMAGRDFASGFIEIEDGKIARVGDMKELAQADIAGIENFDAQGFTAVPGFVDAHCHVGMWEDGEGQEGADGNEDTDPITPHLRAIDGINPFDSAFHDAMSSGVTTVVTGPGSTNVLGGQFAAMKTAGHSVEEMLIKAPVAQKAALGENPKATYGGQKQSPKTRMATAALLREALFRARKEPENFRLSPLIPVLEGQIPLKVHAHRADDICTAIRIAEEFGIQITLEHCTEGHLICDILKDKNIPINLGPTLGGKTKPELRNLTFETCRTLDQAGIAFAIVTDHPEIPVDKLYLCAVLAVRYGGLDRRKALCAITRQAAENSGILERVGTLEPGKDADIAILSGEIMTLEAEVCAVYLSGKRLFLKNS